MQKSIKILCFVLILVVEWRDVSGFPADNFNIRPSIFLTVNPLNHNIDINWFYLKSSDLSNATIKITENEDDPNLNNTIYEVSLTATEGHMQTYLKHNFTEIDEQTECYSFWYFYIVNGEISQKGCLKANPNWMSKMKAFIKDRKVRELFIPGSHDSSSYKKNFDPETEETLISKYSLTQDDDVRSQLIHGIRYLDIRVGYYRSNKDPFWANHGISRLHPLQEILQQVKDFVDATNEIVILDFQEFPVGFRNSIQVHQNLVAFLTEHLGDYAAHPANGWDTTLDEIWKSGNRIVVAYDHFGIAGEHSETLLFHSVRQRWGKVKEGFGNLEKFLRDQRKNMSYESGFTSRPYAEMAELTPEVVDVLRDRYGGLRKMAYSVNYDVTKLYHGEFGKNSNVVAVDFYLSTNIVEIAIEWNLRKFGNLNSTK